MPNILTTNPPKTALPFDGVSPPPTPSEASLHPLSSENAEQPAVKSTTKKPFFRRLKKNILSSTSSDKKKVEQPSSSTTSEEIIPTFQHQSDEPQVQDEHTQRFFDVVYGNPDANYELPPEVAEAEDRKQKFIEQLHDIPPKPDPQSHVTSPQAEPHSSVSPDSQQLSLPHEQLQTGSEHSSIGPQTLQPTQPTQPPAQTVESASKMAEFFGSRAFGGMSNTFITAPTPPPSKMQLPNNQAWHQSHFVGWASMQDSMTMGSAPSYQQPLAHLTMPTSDGLELDLELAQKIGRGRELGLQAVGLEEAGDLGQAEAAYITAVSILVPASRELEYGSAPSHQMRMRQKTRIQREASVMLDRCEEIKRILKASGPSVPQQMPSMPGSVNSMKNYFSEPGSTGHNAASSNMNTRANINAPPTMPRPKLPPPPPPPPPPPTALSGPDDALHIRLQNRKEE